MAITNVKVTLEEAIKIAIEDKDAAVAGRVADTLRAAGWTYNKILAQVQKLHPEVTRGDWEDLMLQAEELESHS